MYQKVLKDLVSHATEKFFKELTDYNQVACYKVEFKTSENHVSFIASLVTCDKEPELGEWFEIRGYLCYEVEFVTIEDTLKKKTIYNRFA